MVNAQLRQQRKEIKITPPLVTQHVHQDRLRAGFDWEHSQQPSERSEQARRRRNVAHGNTHARRAPVAVGLLARDFQSFLRDKERQNLMRQWNHHQRAIELEDMLVNVVETRLNHNFH